MGTAGEEKAYTPARRILGNVVRGVFRAVEDGVAVRTQQSVGVVRPRPIHQEVEIHRGSRCTVGSHGEPANQGMLDRCAS